ncbi:MAG: DUF58 domain-containing protein [Oligoflexia bacterium]|nr:DUF58 domain-containing protein [Oligoflexia bacterium]
MQAAAINTLLTPEMLAELKRLQIRSRRALDSELIGNYRTAFRGSGLVFSDLRLYAPGDDVKHIHWKASARTSQIYVKSFQEDRQLRLMLMLDISASLQHGAPRNKQARGRELAALLAMLALRSQDLVGLCLFADDVVHYLPPAQSRAQLQRVLLALLDQRPARKATNLACSIKSLRALLKRRSVIFILSDFLDFNPSDSIQQELRLLGLKHDVVAASLEDRLDSELPRAGLIEFEDLESGDRIIIDSSDKAVRRHYELAHQRRLSEWSATCKQCGIDLVRFVDRSLKPLAELMSRRRARVR